MIDIFYYTGFLCLLLSIEEILNGKKRKKDVNKINEAFNTTLESGMAQGFFQIPFKDIMKKSMSGIRLLFGIITTAWVIIGIVISGQRLLFVLLLLTIIFPTNLIIKDEKKQVQVMFLDSIICLILVSSILYNHYLK